jgi:hypothetical protein
VADPRTRRLEENVDWAVNALESRARTPKYRNTGDRPLDGDPRRVERVGDHVLTYRTYPDGIERLVQKVRIAPRDAVVMARKPHNPHAAPGTRIA